MSQQSQPQLRIRVSIRGFDTFTVTSYRIVDGQEVLAGEITYNAHDFDGFIDLDSHDVDFCVAGDGSPIAISQRDDHQD